MQRNKRPYSDIKLFSIVQNACLGAFITGFTGAELSLSFDSIRCNLDLEDPEMMNIIFVFALIFGGLIGSIMYSKLKNYAKKIEIMIFADIIFVTSLAFNYDEWGALTVQRFLKGISNGLNLCAVLLYIREIAPEMKSDKYICIFQINVNLGIVMVNLLSIPLTYIENSSCPSINSTYWQFLFYFPIIIAIIRGCVLVFIFTIDTPYSCYEQSQQLILYDAKTNQQKYSLQVEELLSDGERNLRLINSHTRESAIKAYIQAYREFEYYDERSSPTFRIRWIHVMVACGVQQLSGINSIIQQQDQSILSYTSHKEIQQILSLFMNIVLLVTAIVTYFNVHKYINRDKILTVGCILLALSLFGIYLPLIQIEYKIILVLIYYIVFNSTLGPLVLIYISDISKDQVISRGFYSYWVCYMISSALQFTNWQNIPLIFALCCFIGTYFSLKYLVLTQNQNYFQLANNFTTQISQVSQQLLINQDQNDLNYNLLP